MASRESYTNSKKNNNRRNTLEQLSRKGLMKIMKVVVKRLMMILVRFILLGNLILL